MVDNIISLTLKILSTISSFIATSGLGLCITFVIIVVSTICTLRGSIAISVDDIYNNDKGKKDNCDKNNIVNTFFIVIGEPNWSGLSYISNRFKKETSNILVELSTSLENVLISEDEFINVRSNIRNTKNIPLYSKLLQARIDILSKIFDNDSSILEDVLLKQFQTINVIADQAHNDYDDGFDDSVGYFDEYDDNDDNDDGEQEKDSYISNNGFFKDSKQCQNDNYKIISPFRYMKKKNTKSRKSKQSSFSSTGEESTPASYDTSMQIIAHIVRDWTALGRQTRSSTYKWCRDQLNYHVAKQSNMRKSSKFSPFSADTRNVLIPGAGLARLAYDLAIIDNYNVEANDASLPMAAASYAIFNISLSNKKTDFQIHPFAYDFFVNEVDSNQRYEPVSFPDYHYCCHDGKNDEGSLIVNEDNHSHDEQREEQEKKHNPIINSNNRGSLLYTVGDFVDLYTAKYSTSKFFSIITCFFIDTATNIYEYISTIKSLLDDGGIWINIGPVQWHSNALIKPSVNELRLILESMGFTIQYWSVDNKPLYYRHDEDDDEDKTSSNGENIPPPRYTKLDAYRPLRFVVYNSKNGDGRSKMKNTKMNLGTSSFSTIPTDESSSTSYSSAEKETKSDQKQFSKYVSLQSTVTIEELEDDENNSSAS